MLHSTRTGKSMAYIKKPLPCLLKYLSSSFLLLLAGCNASPTKSNALLVLKTLDNPFFIDIQRAFSSELSSISGLSTITKAGLQESDVVSQKKVLDSQFYSSVQGKAKPSIAGLAITPSSSGSDLVPQIKLFRDARIPVILMDTGISKKFFDAAGTDYNVLVKTDNAAGGRIAANALARNLKSKGKDCLVAFINGVPESDSAQDRRKGFLSEANQLGCKVVVEKTANWRRDEAQRSMRQLLSKYTFNGIFAANDEMAIGALLALNEASLTNNDITVIGFDAIPEAQRLIKEGKLFASVAQNPSRMGKTAATEIAKISRTQKFPVFQDTLLPPDLFTRESKNEQ
jgi:ribose transport system substrate-binding protein